jgi:nitric oxide reductase NorQ protein
MDSSNSVSGLSTTVFMPQPGTDFVVTPYVQDITERALAYLRIGYPLHLTGPAGTGKSTLAMHIASHLGQHCTLMHGDDEFRSSDLIGKDAGYRKSSVIDNYVSKIVKTTENMSILWTSNRLTEACQKGHTLIYDEFTRSPATANNPFLSILEEGILNIPSSGKEQGYIKVHPNFRAIFTSNPDDYAGLHKTQDALLDRMITLRLDHQDQDTEISIVCSKSHRNRQDATTIVEITRAIRDLCGGLNGPSIRAGIAIARIVDHRNCRVDSDDAIFLTTCRDVLYSHLLRDAKEPSDLERFDHIIRSFGKPTTSSLQELRTEVASETPVAHAQDSVATHLPNDVAATTQRADDEDLLESVEELSREIEEVSTASSPSSRVPISGRAQLFPLPNSDVEARIVSHSREPRIDSTANSLQMLEAAISRFPRPPEVL